MHLDGDHTDVTGETKPLGSAFHDKATVTSTDSFTITGTVTYEFFTNDQCDGTPESQRDSQRRHRILLDGRAPAGRLQLPGELRGDANHAGATADCEPFHVAKADTSTATEVHLDGDHTDVTGETKPLGSAFHDKASVTATNNAFTITGTVTYEFFTNDTCDGSPVGSEAVSVGSESSSTGPLAAGSYSFRATYNGDSNYNGSAESGCEPFHVAKADTSTATEVHLDGNHADVTGETKPLGSAFHDQATVSGEQAGFPITARDLRVLHQRHLRRHPRQLRDRQRRHRVVLDRRPGRPATTASS